MESRIYLKKSILIALRHMHIKNRGISHFIDQQQDYCSGDHRPGFILHSYDSAVPMEEESEESSITPFLLRSDAHASINVLPQHKQRLRVIITWQDADFSVTFNSPFSPSMNQSRGKSV